MTTDLPNRIGTHKLGLISGFTRRYGVHKLVYVEAHDSILEARARERTFKRWHRAWKLALIEKNNPQWRDLSDEI